MMRRLRLFWEWLTRTESRYATVTNPVKDRSLHGKARRKARRG